MMEIAFGPVIAACALKSLVFGALFAIIFPILETRISKGRVTTGLTRRIGLGLLGGGLFGIAHLVLVCAADGFPPRIIQSTAVALALVAATGFIVVRNASCTVPVRS